MGKRNVLIEGVSGTGKTSICDALLCRGFHAIHGDRDLRSAATHDSASLSLSHAERAAFVHAQANWDVPKVLNHLENSQRPVSFFCGGFRNHEELVGLFDLVFVLEVDRDTLMRRLEARSDDEFGGKPAEKTLIEKLHFTGEDMPKGATPIDARNPIDQVADDVVKICRQFGFVS